MRHADSRYKPDLVLDLQKVTFRRGHTEILKGVDLQVRAGEHWALLGPNGAGKSTLLGFCGATTFPTSGTVDVLGHRMGRVELAALRKRIGQVNPRHPLQAPLTILEVVLTGFSGNIQGSVRWEPSARELSRARDLVDLFGLGSRADSRWPTMSQGERGRALIARALVAAPDLLLLDEPATGLDLAAREQLINTVDILKTTFPDLASVLVTHHLEELPRSTSHCVVLADGTVVDSGPIDETLTSASITQAFRHPIDVNRVAGRWAATTRLVADKPER